MNENTNSRLASSLSLDESFEYQENNANQNWLLTYIDVFVLIVMLFVTLVALSNFRTDGVSPEKSNAATVKKTPAAKISQAIVQVPPSDNTPKKTELPIKINPTATPETKMTDIIEPTEPIEPIEPIESIESIEQVELIKKAAQNAHTLTDQTVTERDSPDDKEKTLQQQLNDQLEYLGLKDSIQMKVTQGYARLEIQDNILYQSSDAKLTDSGQAVLKRLTPLLQQSTGLIYIEGHTDNRPIKTKQYPSNWELGAARATSVLHFLASQQIDASRMRAISYADTQPIADNNSEQGQQKNRRVNIVIKVSKQ